MDWCPETDSQKLAFGRGTAICKFGIRLGNKLAWGETVINFENPSWKRRYRFAKSVSQETIQPGGRENATCASITCQIVFAEIYKLISQKV